MHGLQTNAWTTCSFIQDTLVDRPSLSNPPSKIVAHKLCIAMHHQWVASYPSIASVPGRFTQRGYLLPISGWHCTHPLRLKKHPSGSSHTNPLFTIMRWFTIVVTSTSPHTRIIRVTMLHFHVASNRTKFGWFGRPFWTHAYVDLLIHSQKKGKTRLVLLHRSTSQTNVATVSVARMKLMFVRWFGRPFWTHTDVHLLVYTLLFVRWFGRPFWTHADVHPQIPGIHSKENSTCTAASQREPNQWVDSIRLPEWNSCSSYLVPVSIAVNT